MADHAALYRSMFLIRRFEEIVLDAFSRGVLTGTTHTYIGQEADAAGIFSVTEDDDVVFSNHRCHGHFLAYGGDPYRLFAEMMGKATGLVGGRGGSQHIHWKNFYTNGIQGGIVPVATGMALAEKKKGNSNIVLVFIGDGTLGEGVLYESVNIAALWKLPILIVLENNRYAQTTSVQFSLAGSMRERFTAFGWHVWERDTADVLEVQKAAQETILHVRSTSTPACLLLHTQRFMAHSKGDDLRSEDELQRIRQIDPIKIHGERLSVQVKSILEAEIDEELVNAFNRASADPAPFLAKSGDLQ